MLLTTQCEHALTLCELSRADLTLSLLAQSTFPCETG